MVFNKIFSKFKIVILALVLSSTFFVSVAAPIYAQGATPLPQSSADSQNIFDRFKNAVSNTVGTSLQKFTMNTLSYMVQGSLLMLTGCKEASCDPDYKIGALGATANMVAALYTPQASGVEYVASTLRDFDLVEKAYAQTGTGFDGLAPIRDLWRAFRNITYALFVVIFLAIGLAIMFRYKLNPQTTVTIQSALPRIVVALLLVTFSYPIAGFMIDLLYVSISLGALAFRGFPGADNFQPTFTEGGFFTTIGVLNGLTAGTTSIIAAGLGALAGTLISVIPALFVGGLAVANVAFTAGVGALVMLLVLLIIVLYALVRLFFGLLQAYISIIILIIFAPLQIALGIFPGMPGFGSWLRNLTANLAAFAGVAFVLMLGAVLVNTASNGLWQPPILFGGTVGGFVANSVGGIIALGVLLMAHQIPQAVKNAFGVRGLGIGPGEAYRAGATPLNIYAGARATEAERLARLYPGVPGMGWVDRSFAGVTRFFAGR